MILSVLLVSLPLALVTGSVVKFENCCKDPKTQVREIYDDVQKNSPYYVIAVPRTPKTELLDNICYTYFENDNGQLLNAISVVFKNGASAQYFFNVDDYPDKDGVSVSRGPGCSYLDYTIDDLCCGDILILYRCFISLDTCTDVETDIGCIPGMDVRLALSKCPIQEPAQVECLMLKLLHDDRFIGNDFIILPNNLPPMCVTEYNCRDAIRADCAVGEICVKDCCRLTPYVPIPLPSTLLPTNFPHAGIHGTPHVPLAGVATRHSKAHNVFIGRG